MKFKLPKNPRLHLFDICTNDHKEFDGAEVIGEPINIGVRKLKTTVNTYVVKEGYTYLWEACKLYDGSKYYSIWLLYPKGNRPSSIEIENYKNSELIDAVEYKQMIKNKYIEDEKTELQESEETKIYCDNQINLEHFSDYLIENATECFEHQDRQLLLNVLKRYFKQ